jgi:hypothetical protein
MDFLQQIFSRLPQPEGAVYRIEEAVTDLDVRLSFWFMDFSMFLFISRTHCPWTPTMQAESRIVPSGRGGKGE